MGYVIVVLLAALAGGLVYWASMRFSDGADAPAGDGPVSVADEPTPERGGESSDAAGAALDTGTEIEAADEASPSPAPGTAYIPVLRTRGSWQGRLGGIMGLVIAVAVAAATIAFALYEAGHFISKMLSGATGNG